MRRNSYKAVRFLWNGQVKSFAKTLIIAAAQQWVRTRLLWGRRRQAWEGVSGDKMRQKHLRNIRGSISSQQKHGWSHTLNSTVNLSRNLLTLIVQTVSVERDYLGNTKVWPRNECFLAMILECMTLQVSHVSFFWQTQLKGVLESAPMMSWLWRGADHQLIA